MRRCLAVVCLLLFLTACAEEELVCDVSEELINGVNLESGDILLARCSGFLPAVFAGLGDEESDYGHAAVFFHNADGCGAIMHMQPDGVKVCSVSEFREKYYKIGLVRVSDVDSLDSVSFDDVCCRFAAYTRSHAVISDFWDNSSEMAQSGDEEYPASIYCLTMLNMLFRRAGAPEPFRRRYDLRDDPIICYIGGVLHRSNYEIPVVASIYSNTDYTRIGDYFIRESMRTSMYVDNALVQRVSEYLGDGYSIGRMPYVRRPVIVALLGVKLAVTPFMPAGLKAMLGRIDSYRTLSELYMMNSFIKRVRKEAVSYAADNPGEDVFHRTGDIADELRDRYFIMKEPQKQF